MDIFIKYHLIICCVEKVALYVQYVNLIIWISLKTILRNTILFLKKKKDLTIAVIFAFYLSIIIFQIRIYVSRSMVNFIIHMSHTKKVIRHSKVLPSRRQSMSVI